MVERGDLNALNALIKQGVDLNQRDSKGVPLLMRAEEAFMRKNFRQIIQCLLTNGADPSKTDQYGDNALHHIFDVFDVKDDVRPISHEDRIGLIDEFIKYNANVNSKNHSGRTPLHKAVYGRSDNVAEEVAIVRHLLSKGAKIEALSRETVTSKYTPLLYACSKGAYGELVEELLKAGANKRATNSQGYDALKLAVWRMNVDAVNVLLNHDFDVKQRGRKQETLLMIAAGNNQPKMIRTLLQHGAQVNSQDARGQTALMWAISANCLDDPDYDIKVSPQDIYPPSDLDCRETFRLLLEAGADLNIMDKNGKTVLMWAREYKNTLMVTYLQQAGAKK